MQKFSSLIALSCLVGLGATTAHGTLGPGDKAPAITYKEWVKGSPVKNFDKGKVYVVEFWATWCGPCRQSIPHLTELAHEYKGKVTFTGMSIWQRRETIDDVKKFVTDMGDKMDYNVGYCGNQELMAQTWMKAAGQNGIPAAFIVKDGVIQWIGHPMEMNDALGKVVAGKFDVKASRVAFNKEIAAREMEMKASKMMREAVVLHEKGHKKEAEMKLNAAVKMSADLKSEADITRLTWVSQENAVEAKKIVDGLANSKNKDDWFTLGAFAMQSSQKKGLELEVATYAADQVLKATGGKEMIVDYYCASHYAAVGNYAKAVEVCDMVMKYLPESNMKDDENFKDMMQKMRDASQAKLNSTKK